MTHKKKSFRSAAPVWAAFVIPIVWLAVLMAGCYAPGMTIFDLVAQFSEVTKMPFSLHWTPYTMKFIGIFLLLYGGAILFYYTGQKNTRPGEEHGSASWGSVRELDKKYRDKDAGKNVILTQHLQMSMNGKLHRRNLLQIIVGGSGSGKTRFLAKPNLMLANASFIVTDPKSEMLRAVGKLFLEEGYVLRVFDLIDPSKSDCYNPFRYIRKDADVFKLIDSFIKNTTPKGAKANDPFWEKSETALDSALMLYLLHEAPPEDQNMETILYMIENGGAKEEDDDYSSPLDLLFEALEEEQPDHIAVRQYHIFKQAAGVASLSNYFTPEYTNAWPAMFIQSALVYAYYLLPFSMIVVCVMIAGRETGNNGILKMLALPVSRCALSISKFCVLTFYLFMEMVVFLVVFVIAGLIATQTMGVTETLPILYLLKWCLGLFLTMLPCIAAMWAITVLFEKPLLSVGLNLLLVIPGVLVANTPLWIAYPYCYSGYLVSCSLHDFTAETSDAAFSMFPFLPCAIVVFGLFFALAVTQFGKKEMR